MNTFLPRTPHHIAQIFLRGGLLSAVLVGLAGCESATATGDVMPEGMSNGVDHSGAVAKIRGNDLTTLRSLWARRTSIDITPRVVPLLKSPSLTVRERAVVILGRLENASALKPLVAMRSQAPSQSLMAAPEGSSSLFPELQLAIGRIKARRSSGRRKLDVMLSEVGLSSAGLIALSGRINGDKYGWRYIGFRVIEEALDVLVKEKRRGHDVPSLSSALTLRPEQKVVLQAASPSPSIEVERLLDYSARNGSTGGQTPFVIEHILDAGMPEMLLSAISAKLHDPKRYPSPRALIDVLSALASQGNKHASAMLRSLSKQDGRPAVRNAAQSTLDDLPLSK